jgi:hypothetical protein
MTYIRNKQTVLEKITYGHGLCSVQEAGHRPFGGVGRRGQASTVRRSRRPAAALRLQGREKRVCVGCGGSAWCVGHNLVEATIGTGAGSVYQNTRTFFFRATHEHDKLV